MKPSYPLLVAHYCGRLIKFGLMGYILASVLERIRWNFIPDYFSNAFTNNQPLMWTLATLLVHHFAYIQLVGFFSGCDEFGLFQKYKIKREEHQIAASDRIMGSLKEQFVYYLFYHPIIIFILFFVVFKVISLESIGFPSKSQVFWQIVICMFLKDGVFYYVHRVFHEEAWWYINVHKIHHQYWATIAISAEHEHWIEFLVLQANVFMYVFVFKMHLVTFMCWYYIDLFEAFEIHAGYSFPWSSSKYHDYHHTVNMETMANHPFWDVTFGTEEKWFETNNLRDLFF